MMHPKQKQPKENMEELPAGFSNASKRRIANRRKNAHTNMDKELAFLDIETTGLNPESDEIIEIAALAIDESKMKSTWSALIKTEVVVPAVITELTGIESEMLSDGDMEISSALKCLAEIIEDRTVVCYNKKFDILFLENAYKENGMTCPIGKGVDVLTLARKRITDISNYKLGSLAEYFEISCEGQHRALADCEVLYKVFLKLNEI